jgi:hypothetical protein
LTRGGSPVETYTGETGADNWYSGYFTNQMQPGDVITVSGGGETLSYTILPFTASLDASANQVSGVTSPGRRVAAWFDKRYWGYIITSCYYDSDCAYTNTSNGAYAIPSSFDLAESGVHRSVRREATTSMQLVCPGDRRRSHLG